MQQSEQLSFFQLSPAARAKLADAGSRLKMALTLPKHRRMVALGIAAAGILLAWFAREPSGLIVTVAAVSVGFGWRAGLAAVAVVGVVAAPILLSVDQSNAGGGFNLAVFLAAALGVWLLVRLFRRVSFDNLVNESARQILDNLPGLGWSTDPEGRVAFINPASVAHMGLTPTEVGKLVHVDQFARLVIHPDDIEANLARWRHSLRTGEPYHDESRSLRHDGVYRWFRDTAVPVRDESGRITGWFGTTIDIDDQKKAEAALRDSERELRLLVDTVPTLIWLMTPDAQPYYFNKRFVDWAALAPADNASAPPPQTAVLELVHPDDRTAVAAAFERSLATGDPLQHRQRLRRRDGQYRWMESRVEPLRDESGTIIRWYGVNLDIDDEVAAQEALRLAHERLARTSRAASLAELSVSIAHEINQPLGAVVANAHAFQRWLAADPPNFERAKGTAAKIVRDANAASEVIRRIRALFTQAEQIRHPVDVNRVIHEVSELLADTLGPNDVTLEMSLDPRLPKISADPMQIEQVVFNLARNAVEAMQSVDRPSRILRIISRRQGDTGVEVEVHDNGPGISDPERIFEAFYTTKDDGLGMGLAICRSIVEAHSGRICATSKPGEGTSLIFSLPRPPNGDRHALG